MSDPPPVRADPAAPGAARGDRLGAALLLLLATLVLYSPFLLGGRVFLPADFLSFVYPWKSSAPPSARVQNLETFDVLVYFYPQDLLLNQSLKRGDLPLWNPQIFSGHPLVANGSAALFYPGRLLLHRLLPAAQARTLSLLLHTLALGFSMFYYLSRRGFHPLAAGLGGLVWMLNACMSTWLEFEHVLIIGTYVPWMLLGVERGILTGRWSWWALVAAAGGLALSGGHVQFNLYTGPVVGMVALLRMRETGRWSALPRLLLAGALAVMLAAPGLLPFLELQRLSQRQAALVLSAQAAPLWSYLPTLVCPDAWGNPARGVMLNRCGANLVFSEFACYLGVLPLLLALLALAPRGPRLPASRAELLLWGGIAAVALWAASATPPYGLLAGSLGFLSRLIPGRVLIVFVLAGAVLAAAGMERLLRDFPASAPWLGRMGGALGALWGVWLLGLAWQLEGDARGFSQWLIPLLKIPPRDTPDLGAALVGMVRSATLGNPQYYVPLAACLVCLRLFRLSPAAAARLILGFTAVDLLLLATVYNPTANPRSLEPASEAVRYVQEQPGLFRVDKFRAAFYNTLCPYGLQLASGYESLFPARYYRAMSLVEPGVTLPVRSLALAKFDHPLLDLLNLRWVIAAPQEGLPGPRWVERLSADARVFENRSALPRARVVRQVTPCADMEEALAFLDRPDFDPSRQACLEGPVPSDLPRGEASDSLTFLDYQPDRVELGADLSAPGLLVLADQWYPGWRVRVDGQDRPLYPADVVCRGVWLPGGSHRVEFTFEPAPLKLGLQLAAGACLGLLAMLVLPWLVGRRSLSERPPS